VEEFFIGMATMSVEQRIKRAVLTPTDSI